MSNMRADFSRTGQAGPDGVIRQSPLESVLGARFHHLMPQLRQLHGGRALNWKGQATVDAPRSPVARLLARLFGLPAETQKAPIAFDITPQPDGSETWQRHFADCTMVSSLRAGTDGTALEERFGPVTLIMVPEVREDRLNFVCKGAYLGGKLRLPGFLTPRAKAVIWQDEAGRYRFDIASELPLIGRLTRYQGWMRPDTASAFAGF